MSTAAAIPIASFGNNPEVAQAIREKLLPEYDGSSILVSFPPRLHYHYHYPYPYPCTVSSIPTPH